MLEAEAERLLARRIGMFSTTAQIKAGARKMVDRALSQSRKQVNA
jgi:hypothetical protein